jgi:hypothetical protein
MRSDQSPFDTITSKCPTSEHCLETKSSTHELWGTLQILTLTTLHVFKKILKFNSEKGWEFMRMFLGSSRKAAMNLVLAVLEIEEQVIHWFGPSESVVPLRCADAYAFRVSGDLFHLKDPLGIEFRHLWQHFLKPWCHVCVLSTIF